MRILTIFFLLWTTLSSAQENEENIGFVIVDKSAEPSCGMDAWYRHIAYFCSNHFRHYLGRKDAGGKVFVSFAVEADGTLSDISVIRGLDPFLDSIAIQVILTGCEWNPALIDDKPVKGIKFTIPIVFRDEGVHKVRDEFKKIPIAKIGDMKFTKFIHEKAISYSKKKEIQPEQIVYVKIVLDEFGKQKEVKIYKSDNHKLNKRAIKFVKSYKGGWIIPSGENVEKESIIFPIIFSKELNVDNL